MISTDTELTDTFEQKEISGREEVESRKESRTPRTSVGREKNEKVRSGFKKTERRETQRE